MAFPKHVFKCKFHTSLSKYKEFYKKTNPLQIDPNVWIAIMLWCRHKVIQHWLLGGGGGGGGRGGGGGGGGGRWKGGDVTITNCIELTSLSRQLHYLYCASQDCFQLCVQFSKSSLKSFLPKLICLRLNLLLSPVTESPR